MCELSLVFSAFLAFISFGFCVVYVDGFRDFAARECVNSFPKHKKKHTHSYTRIRISKSDQYAILYLCSVVARHIVCYWWNKRGCCFSGFFGFAPPFRWAITNRTFSNMFKWFKWMSIIYIYGNKENWIFSTFFFFFFAFTFRKKKIVSVYMVNK